MKIALGIEYDGSKYQGWQRQSDIPTIQFTLEQALGKIANHTITTFCAGRTDALVHATAQVIHFTTHSIRKLSAWTYGVNSYLPNSIKVVWAKEVPDDFHARFKALRREYSYIILNTPLPSALMAGRVTFIRQALDASLMHAAAQNLLGEHDFTSFRAAKCQSLSPMRNLISINISRRETLIICTITANAFLYHMVRNIIGSLLKVGTGEKDLDWVKWLLIEKNRSLAAPTAPPDGLYLTDVSYSAKYNLPQSPKRILFF